MKIREAAMLPALVAAFIQFILPFFTNFTPETSGVVNGALAFAATLITTFMVSAEKGLAFMAGSASTLIQLGIGFGLHITDSQAAVFASLLTMVAAAYTRTQAVAPKPAVATRLIAEQGGRVVQVPNQAGGQL